MTHERREGWRGRWRAGQRAVMRMDIVDLVPRLTPLLLLFNPLGEGVVRSFGLLLAGLGVVFTALTRRPGFWLCLALLCGWRVVDDWPLADNHAYLLSYWCVALFVSFLMKDQRASLALNGRLLIGLAFACATLWKTVFSPDYLDGTFFRVMLMADERFEAPVLFVSGLSTEQLDANRRFLAEENELDIFQSETPMLIEPARLKGFAQAATWWTVLIEAAVAMSFLWPRQDWVFRQRHFALALFCLTTYAIAPVVGFGWLLLIMGMAQCEPERRSVRAMYLILFFVLLFYQVLPWTVMND